MAKDSLFLAKDVHPRWQALLDNKCREVLVFTPYFDHLLPKLLAKSVVYGASITVVTDFSPTGGKDNYRQLKAGLELLQQGIILRNLPRLHAKILMVDRKDIVLGSQNFTSFGRRSKEASASPTSHVLDLNFLKSLDKWIAESTIIDVAMLEILLDQLVTQAKKLEKLEKDLKEQFEKLLLQENERRHQEIKQKLAVAISNSKTSLEQELALGSLRFLGDIFTFGVENGNDLTRWVNRSERIRLARLTMVPIVSAQSGQMAFARIAKTRITYIRYSVRLAKPIEIDGRQFLATVDFPKHDCLNCNLIATLRNARTEKEIVKVKFYFDGLDLNLKGVELAGKQTKTVHNQIICDSMNEHFAVEDNRRDFFKSHFKRFTYQRLNIDNHNARDFFSSGVQAISILEYAETPVLVVNRYE